MPPDRSVLDTNDKMNKILPVQALIRSEINELKKLTFNAANVLLFLAASLPF